MTYVPDLERILEAMNNTDCCGIYVKGLNFEPDDVDALRLLTMIAHSSEVREELIVLIDLLNAALMASKPRGTGVGTEQEAA